MNDSELISIENIKIGVFVKLVDRDNNGRFSYTGEVVVIQKETKHFPPSFEMLTFEGTMGFEFPRTNNTDKIITGSNSTGKVMNELYITTAKPKGWARFKKNPISFKKTEIEAKKIEPVKTKKEKVFELVTTNPRKRETSLLKLAKKEIGGADSQLISFIRLALAKQ